MKAVVIGGGIIGLSSAYFLVKKGWDVTIIDKTDLSDNCSHGNLGMIVPSHFIPLAAPGIVSQGIRWMFNSKSPFYVKPSLNRNLINWGVKFIKSATVRNVENAASHLLEINLLSKQLYEEMSSQPGFDFSFEKKGIMMYYKTEQVAEEEMHTAEKAKRMGLDVVVLSAKEAQALETGTELNVLGAVHYRSDAHLYPNKLNEQLVASLKQSGVQFCTNCQVTSITRSQNKITSILAGGEEFSGDIFITASGSWLPELLRMADISLPLMPGKGYSFTHSLPGKQLVIPAILCEARVAMTPMGANLRLGGTMEIGPVNNKINMSRVQGIVEAIPAYMPDMGVTMPAKEKVWYGFRPCSPDGLPYIGFGKRYTNLLIAGGHAMMGLSLGPATGQLIAEMAEGTQTSIGVKAFDPSRFD